VSFVTRQASGRVVRALGMNRPRLALLVYSTSGRLLKTIPALTAQQLASGHARTSEVDSPAWSADPKRIAYAVRDRNSAKPAAAKA